MKLDGVQGLDLVYQTMLPSLWGWNLVGDACSVSGDEMLWAMSTAHPKAMVIIASLNHCPAGSMEGTWPCDSLHQTCECLVMAKD